METIPCIFGHGFSDEIAIEENGFQGRRCCECGLIYISPRPEASEIFDVYHHDKAYLPAVHHTRYNPAAELAAQKHFSWISKKNPLNCEAPRKGCSILEIGCGGGHLLKVAKENGFDAYGVELNPSQAKHVQDVLKIPCETKPFSLDSFGSKKFDFIFHSDVASHLSDPVRDFSMMAEKLTDSGQMIFETGNGADITERYYKYIPAWQYPDHLFFFGESSIRELLRRTGFASVEIHSWSILPQLAMSRFFHREKKRRNKSIVQGSTGVSLQPISLKNRLRRIFAARLWYFIRFGIGRLSTNPRVPRAMIVWASKSGAGQIKGMKGK